MIKTLLRFTYLLGITCLGIACSSCSKDDPMGKPEPDQSAQKSIAFLKEELNKPESEYVLVVAHRGDWHNGPENSMMAFEKAVELGVDMVEVDVRKTKDGVLVLMHDESLDRTTTGTGLVSDHTLAEIQELYLKAHTGQVTQRKVPTLKEIMAYAKGKVLVNIDKADGHFEEIGAVLRETGTLDIAVVKSGKSVKAIEADMPHIAGSPFMAVISLDKNAEPLQKIDDYIAAYAPKLMEISYQTENSEFFNQYEDLLAKGVKIWMTPCSAEFCAGHDDERALEGDADGAWGWLIDHGATMLLTDQPKELIAYLEEKGLRD